MKSICLTRRRSTSFTFLLTALLLTALPAFAGNLVLNATGGTFTMGSGVGSTVSLTGATTTSPAGSISFSCTISSIGGTYPVAYACTGGSFTFTSNDGSTTVSGAFTTADVDEWIYGGGRGGQTHYSYEFLGPFSGVETLNGVSAAVNGEIVVSVGTFTSPLGSTTAGASTTGVNWDYTPLYVADYSFSRIIQVDDIFGTNELSFGSTGTGTNHFYGTSGIALDSSGRIYIGDLYNARIVRIDDMTGKNWTTFGTYGSGANQFSYATGDIAIDSQGRIYVMDIGNGRTDRFDDMNGTNWTTFGTPGTGVNQFEGASGIAFDSAGLLSLSGGSDSEITLEGWRNLHGLNWAPSGKGLYSGCMSPKAMPFSTSISRERSRAVAAARNRRRCLGSTFTGRPLSRHRR